MSFFIPRFTWTVALLVLLPFATLSHAQVLQVGVKEAPPFVMIEDGRYSGISIEIFQRAAEHLNLEYEFVERDLEGLIEGLQNGQLDASVAALTVTADREQIVDFSHPYYATGLAIATRSEHRGLWASVAKLFSLEFLYAVAALGALLWSVGIVVWLVERRQNSEQFGGSAAQGIGAGFWWAAVTMTTVGYGDKAPETFWGRVVGLVWMFAAIILISGFTAAIATSLTVNSLDSRINGLDDLNGVNVMTVADSSSADFLDDERIRYRTATSVERAVAALASGKADAVVHDAPLLTYHVNTSGEPISLLPNIFLKQDYAIALPSGSALREPLNQALLTLLASESWQIRAAELLGE